MSLLSIVAVSGGVDLAPLELLQQHLSRSLEAISAAASSGLGEAGGALGGTLSHLRRGRTSKADRTLPTPKGGPGVDTVPEGASGALLGDSSGLSAIVVFCCDLLELLPPPLLSPLAERVILPAAQDVRMMGSQIGRLVKGGWEVCRCDMELNPPLPQVLGGPASCHRLLLHQAKKGTGVTGVGAWVQTEARQTSRQLSQLHHLGLVLGIEPWAQSFEDHITSSQSQGKGGKADSMPLDTVVGSSLRQSMAAESREGTREDAMEVELTTAPRSGSDVDIRSGSGSGASALLSSDPGIPVKASSSLSLQDDPQAVIASIRREEFGIYDENNSEDDAAGDNVAMALLGEAGLRLREVQNARMGRALMRLSHELYSKDSHFVLELIQVCEGQGRTLASYQPPSFLFPCIVLTERR